MLSPSIFAAVSSNISRFTHEINNWVKVQQESEEFQQLVHSLALPTKLQRDNWRNFVGERSTVICIICQSVLNSFIEYRKQGMSAEDIKFKVIKLCTRLNLQTKQVCDGAVTINLVSKLRIVINFNKISKIENFYFIVIICRSFFIGNNNTFLT